MYRCAESNLLLAFIHLLSPPTVYTAEMDTYCIPQKYMTQTYHGHRLFSHLVEVESFNSYRMWGWWWWGGGGGVKKTRINVNKKRSWLKGGGWGGGRVGGGGGGK